MTTTGEPLSSLNEIANDASRATADRRHAVFQLFAGHVRPGMTLAELAEVLAGAEWLRDEDVSVVTAIAGKIPVTWSSEDTVFVLHVLPEAGDGGTWAIYLRVLGRVRREELIRVLRTGDGGEAASARVAEIGLSPALSS